MTTGQGEEGDTKGDAKADTKGPALPSAPVSLLRRIYSILWRWVVTPILTFIIGSILVVRIKGIWSGPDNYIIYFVGDISDDSVKKMSEGFQEQFGSAKLMIDGKPVTFAERNDMGDPNMAGKIAKDLADRPDTLFVVGHGYSSTSKVALPIYLAADQPIPTILPTETNPTLAPPSAEFVPSYRLAPSDTKQAQKAAKYGMTKPLEASSFWVISDPENPVYSQYLAAEFTRQVHQVRGRMVVLTTEAGPAFPPDFPRILGVQCAFFAGQWSPALTVVRQLRKMFPQMPIMLSDGAANQQFLEQGWPDIEGAYILHPRKAEEIEKFGYSYCGRDAAFIAASLIKEAAERFNELSKGQSSSWHFLKWILNIHGVSDSRVAIRMVMEERTRPNRNEFRAPSGEKYLFNFRGEPENLDYRVWLVKQKHFVTVPEP